MNDDSLTDSLLETLGVFEESGTPRTTSEVADILDLGRRSTYERLDRLVDRGLLETKKVGASGRVWWRATGDSSVVTSSHLFEQFDRGSASNTAQTPFELPSIAILDSLEVGILVVTPVNDVAWINEAAERFYGVDREEVIGEGTRDLFCNRVSDRLDSTGADDGSVHTSDSEEVAGVLAGNDLENGGDGTVGESIKYRVLPGEGRRERWLEHRRRPIESGPYTGGRLEVVFDVTERKRTNERLEDEQERFQSLVEAVDEYAIFMLDPKGRVRTWNEGGKRLKGYEAEEILGEHMSRFYTAEDCDAGVPEDNLTSAREEGVADCEGWRVEKDGSKFWAHVTITPIYDESGNLEGYAKVTRDMTDRREHEREIEVERKRALEEAKSRYRTLVEHFPNGAVALVDEQLRYTTVGGTPIDEADATVADLEGRHIDEILPPELADVLVPRYADALEGETAEFEDEIGDCVYQFRTLPVRDVEGNVFAAMGMSQDVTNRVAREIELDRQRERLAALNDLHDVFRNVTKAVIEQSTRDNIETIVCERLAESDSYTFAWFCEVDPRTLSVEPKVEVGVDGYLEEISLSVDLEEPSGRGPTGRAVQTRDVQIVQNVFEDPDFEPWREYAAEYGYQSAAAIPVTHEDTIYGVLGVYTDRKVAFTDDEQAVIGQLGEVVGHSIAAVERKRALMNDEVVELELQIRDVVGAFDLSADGEGSILLEHSVPVGDGIFLEYGTASGGALTIIETLVETDVLPHWESVTVLETDGERADFELKLTEPLASTEITAQGGYLDEARLEDGDFYMRVHLPPSANVRQVIDAIEASYPPIEMVTRRQVTLDQEGIAQISGTLFEKLTDRQRAAIQAAYHAGYFSWPRNTTGEQVAASMAVSPSTFHQHLRKAQRKILSTVLEDGTTISSANNR